MPAWFSTLVTTPLPKSPVCEDIKSTLSPGAYSAPLDLIVIVDIPTSIVGSKPEPETFAFIFMFSSCLNVPLTLDSNICIRSRPPILLRTTPSTKASDNVSIPCIVLPIKV